MTGPETKQEVETLRKHAKLTVLSLLIAMASAIGIVLTLYGAAKYDW